MEKVFSIKNFINLVTLIRIIERIKETAIMTGIIEKNLKDIEKICKRRHVLRLYTFGSVNTDHFQEDSDIDLLVHFRGSEAQRNDLVNWLEGWSHALAGGVIAASGLAILVLGL